MSQSTYQWEDPLHFADQLSAEERMISESAREFAEQTLMPKVKAAFNEEKFDPSIMREMGAAGDRKSVV